MSQVSKIDEAIYRLMGLPDDSIHDAFKRAQNFKQKDFDKHKAELLSIILEALPEKQNGSWCCHSDDDDWHHIAPENRLRGYSDCGLHEFAGGSTGDASFNAALDEASKALNGVFGVEK